MHTEWSQFFGRFHPLIVHLPIGFILFAALLCIISAYKKSSLLTSAINLALLAGAISAGLAAVSGYFLSINGGYNNETLSWHKWIGISAAILTFTVWLIRVKKKADVYFFRMRISSWLLSLCILLITIGGHLGGSMTHGEGYLTRYMPGFLKSFFVSKKQPEQKKIIPPLDSVIVFADIIQPIFNNRCITCHNADKNKGELNLTNIEGILKGGKSGNTVVAGNIEKSELFHRITLPPTSSKFMPSDNRPPLTPVEINFIREWIETGADYKKNITASGADEKTKYLIAAYLGIDAENTKEIKLPEVKPADSNALKQLKELNIIIRPLTSKSNLLEASFVTVQKKQAFEILSMLEKLSSVRQQLYRLDVSNCGLTKESIRIISGFSRLNKLELQKNNLTDESIEPLGALQQLEILNAGENKLTDKSVGTFKKLPLLKRINLWQTGITEEAAKDLQSQSKNIVVER